MCTKEEFTARIAQGLADRKAEREAAEIEEAERRAYEHYRAEIIDLWGALWGAARSDTANRFSRLDKSSHCSDPRWSLPLRYTIV